MNKQEIIELINQERIRQGITHREFAKMLGISTSNYNYWMHGGGILLETADRALKALGISATIGKEDHSG